MIHRLLKMYLKENEKQKIKTKKYNKTQEIKKQKQKLCFFSLMIFFEL